MKNKSKDTKFSIDSEAQRAFQELESRFKLSRDYLKNSVDSEEKRIRLLEIDKSIEKVKTFRERNLNQIKKLKTVRGEVFKLGDTFNIKGNLKTNYKVTLFPDSVTVRGEACNPYIGEPWTCEAYIESIAKVEQEKEAKKDKKKKKKKDKPKKKKDEKSKSKETKGNSKAKFNFSSPKVSKKKKKDKSKKKVRS